MAVALLVGLILLIFIVLDTMHNAYASKDVASVIGMGIAIATLTVIFCLLMVTL